MKKHKVERIVDVMRKFFERVPRESQIASPFEKLRDHVDAADPGDSYANLAQALEGEPRIARISGIVFELADHYVMKITDPAERVCAEAHIIELGMKAGGKEASEYYERFKRLIVEHEERIINPNTSEDYQLISQLAGMYLRRGRLAEGSALARHLYDQGKEFIKQPAGNIDALLLMAEESYARGASKIAQRLCTIAYLRWRILTSDTGLSFSWVNKVLDVIRTAQRLGGGFEVVPKDVPLTTPTQEQLGLAAERMLAHPLFASGESYPGSRLKISIAVEFGALIQYYQQYLNGEANVRMLSYYWHNMNQLQTSLQRLQEAESTGLAEEAYCQVGLEVLAEIEAGIGRGKAAVTALDKLPEDAARARELANSAAALKKFEDEQDFQRLPRPAEAPETPVDQLPISVGTANAVIGLPSEIQFTPTELDQMEREAEKELNDLLRRQREQEIKDISEARDQQNRRP